MRGVGGVGSEMELAYAGLHQLLAPLLGHLGGLPGPQRDALRTAFGLSAGPAPDRFLVGLAVLGLVSEVAGERPLICVVDDEQYLELERSAGRAQARGGLAAARAKREAGELDAALGLLAATEAGPLDAHQAAEMESLRGQIAPERPRPRGCWASRPASALCSAAARPPTGITSRSQLDRVLPADPDTARRR